LVRAGNYTSFVLDGKALTVVADDGAEVFVSGEARVENAPGGRPVLLSGLSVVSGGGYGLFVRDNLGNVHVRGGSYAGHEGFGFGQAGGQAAQITKSGLVRVVGATLQGGDGWSGFGPGWGGPGVFARDVELELFDCVVRGGDGASDNFEEGYDGGFGRNAYESPDASLFAANTLFRGGDGGHGGEEDGFPPRFGNEAGDGGDGGHGLFLGSSPAGTSNPTATLLACSTNGGAGGFGGLGAWLPSGQPGSPGQAVLIANGTHVPLAGSARIATGTRVARENTSLSFQFTGVAGERVVMRVESTSPKAVGTIPIRVPKPRELGTLSAGGTLTAQVPLAGWGALTEGLTWFVAFDFIGTDNVVRRGTPLAIVILDAQF
jgi:hypothetical protein